MSNNNAIMPFTGAPGKELQESLGVAALALGGDDDFWHQTVGGLLLQGGTFLIDTDTTVTVNFNVPYTKTCLWLGLTIIGTGSGFASTIEWVSVAADGTTFDASYGTEAALSETDVQIRWFAIGL